MYDTGIDRNAGSNFRRRSRQNGALGRLIATMERGTRFDRDLMTHVKLNQTHTDRIRDEITTLTRRVG